jgi:hypothetical protein
MLRIQRARPAPGDHDPARLRMIGSYAFKVAEPNCDITATIGHFRPADRASVLAFTTTILLWTATKPNVANTAMNGTMNKIEFGVSRGTAHE